MRNKGGGRRKDKGGKCKASASGVTKDRDSGDERSATSRGREAAILRKWGIGLAEEQVLAEEKVLAEEQEREQEQGQGQEKEKEQEQGQEKEQEQGESLSLTQALPGDVFVHLAPFLIGKAWDRFRETCKFAQDLGKRGDVNRELRRLAMAVGVVGVRAGCS